MHLNANNNTYYLSETFIATTIGGDSIHPPEWVYNLYAAKLTSTGNVEWIYQPDNGGMIAGDVQRSFDLSIHPYGDGIHVCGTVRGTMDWGNGFQSTGGLPGQDMFVIALNANGQVEQLINGADATHHRSTAALTKGNALYTVVSNYDTLDLPGVSIPESGSNFFLVRWNDLANSIDTNEDRPEVVLFPNPASDRVYLSGQATPSEYLIMDIHGQLVQQGTHASFIPLDDLAPGTYLLMLGSDPLQTSKRILIVQR